jgi:hypothetical protein
VASYWAATEQDEPTLDAVHSIITLDSPIRGLADIETATRFADAAGLPGLVDLVSLVAASAAGQDLQSREALDLMAQAPGRVDVYSFGNEADLFVPPATPHGWEPMESVEPSVRGRARPSSRRAALSPFQTSFLSLHLCSPAYLVELTFVRRTASLPSARTISSTMAQSSTID